MLLSWAAGAASVVVFLGWMQEDATCEELSHWQFDSADAHPAWMPTVEYSLATYSRMLLRYFLPASFVLAFVPLPPSLYVGNRGIAFLAPIAPVVLFIASGLVCVVWGIVVLLLTICGKVSSLLFCRYVGSHDKDWLNIPNFLAGEGRRQFKKGQCSRC